MVFNHRSQIFNVQIVIDCSVRLTTGKAVGLISIHPRVRVFAQAQLSSLLYLPALQSFSAIYMV